MARKKLVPAFLNTADRPPGSRLVPDAAQTAAVAAAYLRFAQTEMAPS